MKGYPKRDLLWDLWQGPRDPRSPEYMAGVKATLDFLAERDETGTKPSLANPHAPGTAQSDAWYAGNREAHGLWSRSE